MHRNSVLAFVLVAAGLGVATPGMAQTPGAIAAMQRQLQQAGYDPGPIDGVVSDKTLAAIGAYEHATGHAPGGMPVDAAAGAVRSAQAALHRLGFLAQAPDGVVGPETRTAIIRFETANHLPVDPRVSDGLLADLQQSSASAAAAPPAMPPRVPLPPGVTPPPIPQPATAQPPVASQAPPAPAAAPAPTVALPAGVTPPPIAPSAAASPAAPAPQAAPPQSGQAATATLPSALGRQALPAGVTPPPIH